MAQIDENERTRGRAEAKFGFFRSWRGICHGHGIVGGHQHAHLAWTHLVHLAIHWLGACSLAAWNAGFPVG